MTEENKDSNPPKLRLSRKPQEPGTEPKADKAAAPEETSAPKPDLRLRRPDAGSETKEPERHQSEAKRPTPPAKSPAEAPTENNPAKKPVEPPEDRAFDPENPFKGIVEEPKPKNKDRLPPELPSKPHPVQNDGSAQRAEQALGQIHEEKQHKSVLASVIVIVALLALLGGSGYGLYYVLLKAPEDTTANAPQEQTPVAEEAEKEGEKSGSMLSQPIEKAKAVVSEIQDPESAWTDEESPAPTEKPSAKVDETKPVETAEAEPESSPSAVDSPQTSSVSEFLQNVHIGGVRTGERPKLILNGQSYDKGDLVDPDTGLRFIGFRDKKLAFQDAQGIVYIKSF